MHLGAVVRSVDVGVEPSLGQGQGVNAHHLNQWALLDPVVRVPAEKAVRREREDPRRTLAC